ncbi:MAG: sigma-70 family RNA polymerase sigma factor [Lawsonibacter sp.]
MMYKNKNTSSGNPDFQSMTDEEICLLAGAGNAAAEEALVQRYGRMVRACARPLFLAGGDSEDFFQEGMMGLLSAIRSFESGRDASFRTYAEVCIRRRLYSAIRAAQGNKHFPLNHSVSFEPPLFDGTNAYLFSSEESPEDVIIGREELRERLAALKGQLSEVRSQDPAALSERTVLWRDRSAAGRTAPKVGGQRRPAHPRAR